MPPAPRARRLLVAALALLAPAVAFAHAVVFPKTSAPGAYERYVLRVPNEKDVATVRVELRVPEGVRVTAFADVPGWALQVVTDSARRITGAVWTGTLPPQRFVEFPFVAANPKAAGRIAWPAVQTYAGGQVVEWTGPEGAKTPASVTTIAPAPSDPAAGPPAGGAPSAAAPSFGAPAWVPWGALVVAFVALGFALRRPPGGERA